MLLGVILSYQSFGLKNWSNLKVIESRIATLQFILGIKTILIRQFQNSSIFGEQLEQCKMPFFASLLSQNDIVKIFIFF